MKNNLFREIPKIDALLENDKIIQLIEETSRNTVLESIRKILENVRNGIKMGTIIELNIESILEDIIALSKEENTYNLKRVVNATGVVIHTNLGRSLISKELEKELVEVSMNYSTLEFDLSNGKRGSRYSHVEDLLCKITGAEAAMVVNNNAAAVMLVLSTMAKGKEVIVSRGQLVEIGGSFRIPEVMKLSGAKLVEVGATNKTHLYDYEREINENTGLLLKVHTSNFKMLGFTEEVPSKELTKLGHTYNIPVYDDLGSGMIVDLSEYGLLKEPTVSECIQADIDIVSFSGDKMLGGPQAGIIVGKKEYIEKMKKNQLTRALRVDKMTLIALEGTLRMYLDNRYKEIPTFEMLTRNYEDIKRMAKQFVEDVHLKTFDVHLEDDYSEVGGGSMPTEKLLTRVMTLTSERYSADELIKALRDYDIPIIARIKDNRVIFDFRTIKEEEYVIIKQCLKNLDEV